MRRISLVTDKTLKLNFLCTFVCRERNFRMFCCVCVCVLVRDDWGMGPSQNPKQNELYRRTILELVLFKIKFIGILVNRII